LGSDEVMLFDGTVSIEILRSVDYDGERIMNIESVRTSFYQEL